MRLWISGVAASLLLLLSVSADAASREQAFEEMGLDMNASYSATRLVESEGQTIRFKEYRRGESFRMEATVQGAESIIIAHEGKAYTLLPAMSTYLETNIEEASAQAGVTGDADISDIERVGRETINGQSTTRYRARQKDQQGQGEGDFWVNDDGVLVKLDMVYKDRRGRTSTVNSELQDLAMGPQPDSLFQVPSNYNSIKTGGFLKSLGSFGRKTTESAQTASAPAEADNSDESAPAQEQDNTRENVAKETAEAVREGFGKFLKRIRD